MVVCVLTRVKLPVRYSQLLLDDVADNPPPSVRCVVAVQKSDYNLVLHGKILLQ